MQTVLPFLLALAAAAPDTAVIPLKEIVVSATKTPQQEANVPNATAVISGAELRRRGTQTLADAIQDIVGLDSGNGSDNGLRLSNIGMWGLKEFDALLVTLDGVPVGGPFNPSLSQIPVEDLDRIEIVKGPQGTLYGVSAFAGMIQAFSRTGEPGIGHLTLGGGSFDDKHGSAGLEQKLKDGTSLRLSGSVQRSDGWQDRTGNEVDRGNINVSRAIGEATLGLSLVTYRDLQKWGTPLPYEAGEIVPGFEVDRNYAVPGAALEHRVYGASAQTT